MELFPLGPIPERLRCSFCDDLAREPFKLPCCPSKTICAKCKSKKPGVCVVCRKPLDVDQCQEHKSLKTTVQVFLKREEKKWREEMEKNGTPVLFTSTLDSQNVPEGKTNVETKVGNEQTEEDRKTVQSSSSLKIDETVINQDVIKGAQTVADPNFSLLPRESLPNSIDDIPSIAHSDNANIDLSSRNHLLFSNPANNTWNQRGVLPAGTNIQNDVLQGLSGPPRLEHSVSGSPQNIMIQPHMRNPMIPGTLNPIMPQQFDPAYSNDPSAWYAMNRGFPGVPAFNPMMSQPGSWNNGNGFPMAHPYGFYPGQQYGGEPYVSDMSFAFQQDYTQHPGYFEANGGYTDESFTGYAPVQNFNTNERGRGGFRGTRGGLPRASSAQEIVPTGKGVEGAPTAPAALRKDPLKLAPSGPKSTVDSQDLFKNVPKGPKAMMQRGRGGGPVRGVSRATSAVQGKNQEERQASRSKSPSQSRRRSPSVVRDKEVKYRSLSRSKSPSASTSRRSRSKSRGRTKSRSRSRTQSVSRSRSITPKVPEKRRSRSRSRSPKESSRRRSRRKRHRSRSTSRHRSGKRRYRRGKESKSHRHEKRGHDSRRNGRKSEDEQDTSAREQDEEGRKKATPDSDENAYINPPDDDYDSSSRKTRDEIHRETGKHGRKKSRSQKARYEDEKFIEEQAERDREASRWK